MSVIREDWSKKSTSVDTTQYDTETGVLVVTFRFGAKYQYWTIPKEVWDKRLTVPSIGKFINSEIKPKYSCTKLE